jgi:hypothetical protein
MRAGLPTISATLRRSLRTCGVVVLNQLVNLSNPEALVETVAGEVLGVDVKDVPGTKRREFLTARLSRPSPNPGAPLLACRRSDPRDRSRRGVTGEIVNIFRIRLARERPAPAL